MIEVKKTSWVKNSIPLFFRMAITMVITLYTSRIVLNILGVEDFGIYNVVGGIVILFTFLNSAMASATQRFLSYDIGKGNQKALSNTFFSVLIIHLIIGIIVVFLCETMGLWYLKEKMQFSKTRYNEVEFVFHISVFTVFFTIFQVPLNSLIISFEKMKVFAYLGLIEALLKLVIVFLLTYIAFDKLKLYSLLTLISAIVIFSYYFIYCYFTFIRKWSGNKFSFDLAKFKILLSYSGWNLFGNLAAMSRLQGHNLLLNYFYGPKVNASYSISLQIQNAVNLFVNNIQLAISPQIIKKYAQGLVNETVVLIFQGARYCFFIMLIVCAPLYFNMEFVLNLWLGIVPDYAISFAKLSIILIIIDSLSGPIMTGIQATGQIKAYQIGVGFLLFFNLPISYICLLIFGHPEIVFVTSILISLFAFLLRLYFLHLALKIRIIKEAIDLITRITISLIICVVIFYIFCNLDIGNSPWMILVLNLLLIIILLFCVFFIGVKTTERVKIYNLIKKITYE